MNTIVRNLSGCLLVAAAALGTARPQTAAQDLRLSDLRAQQTQETISASEPCQRGRAENLNDIFRRHNIAPNSLLTNMGALMEKSDEVILAAVLDSAELLSPSGQSVASYYEVRVIRNWKGRHGPGDLLTFGVPAGGVECDPSVPSHMPFSVLPGEGADWQGVRSGPYVYLLFLRQSAGSETQSVKGFRLTAGDGVQGMFLIRVPSPVASEAERYCAAVLEGSVQHCASYLGTSRSPVIDAYARDPLAKKYAGMPASDFLREVQSVATARGLAEKSTPK